MTNPVECEFEAQVLASVLEGRWPLGVQAELREHVSHCGLCSTVVGMADIFAAANQQSLTSATLPDASRVWWLAQLRARREAAKEAARPILATQIAACAWVAGLLFVCFGIALTWFQSTLGWLNSALALLLSHGAVITLAAAIVVLLPTAAYFAMGKE